MVEEDDDGNIVVTKDDIETKGNPLVVALIQSQ